MKHNAVYKTVYQFRVVETKLEKKSFFEAQYTTETDHDPIWLTVISPGSSFGRHSSLDDAKNAIAYFKENDLIIDQIVHTVE